MKNIKQLQSMPMFKDAFLILAIMRTKEGDIYYRYDPESWQEGIDKYEEMLKDDDVYTMSLSVEVLGTDTEGINFQPVNKASHVKRQILAQTGGYTMVDYFELKDGTTLGITDEVVVLINGDYMHEGDDELGMVDICKHGLSQPTPSPQPTAHNRIIGIDNPGLTGHYIESHNVHTDDGIVRYDRIIMRNGILIIIKDTVIKVFPSLLEDDDDDVIGIIERLNSGE
jgi:hypothetical protein